MKIENKRVCWLVIGFLLFLGTSLLGQNPQNDSGTKRGLQEQALVSTVTSNSSPVADEVPVADSTFVIGNEDVLAISVWKEPDVTRVVPVRSDGKISLPLIGELQATGKTPKQLQAEITSGLQSYISEPEVTIIVQEIKSQRFNILGHVQKPGSYFLSSPMTVVDAIATAGGLRDFAKTKSIYVLRNDGERQVRLPFNYQKVIKGSHSEQNIRLQPRDTVVVP